MKEEELTVKECYKILDNYKTPKIVIKHSENVAKAAYVIGKKLNEKGIKIDLNLLLCACLLHDIFKITEVKDYTLHNSPSEIKEKSEKWDWLKKRFEGKNHEQALKMEFGEKYPKTISICSKHDYSQINFGFDSWEAKLLYYVDKLDIFGKLTTLKTRLDDVHKRYAYKFPATHKNLKFVEETDKKIFLLESEIFKTTGLTPEKLIRLNDADFKDLIKDDFGEL